MAKELGFEILDLQAMPKDGWVLVKPKDSHWKDGFLFPKIYREAESIVRDLLSQNAPVRRAFYAFA